MKSMMKRALLLFACAGLGSQASAQVLSTQVGGVNLTLNGAVSGQAGAFQDVDTGISDEATEWDASAILNGEYVTNGGLAFGARLELDTGQREVEDLERDEIYLYLAGGFGRLELGEQDGPADTLSIHAPIVGLGQIRGDFSRYTGTVALLSPFDTRDDLKIVYLSTPIQGFRWGISYAPEVKSNTSDPNPRRRTLQENAVEVAAAYQVPVGAWAIGSSAAYVRADADARTERGDIDSYSIGLEAVRDQFSIGGAYVSRGDSNSLNPALDEDEWNVGAAWRADRWGLAASASLTQSTVLENRLIGFGGYYELNDYFVLRADLVSINEEPATGASRDGQVALVELSFQF